MFIGSTGHANGDGKADPQSTGLLGTLISLLVAEKSGFQVAESPDLAALNSLAERMSGTAIKHMEEGLVVTTTGAIADVAADKCG